MTGINRLFLILVGASSLWTAAVFAGTTLPPMIDAHAHYSESDATTFLPETVLTKLNAAGITRMVITSMPPHHAQTLYQRYPERVIPLLGVYTSESNKADWMHDTRLPAWAGTQLQSGAWAGIGELHLFARDAHRPVFAQLVKLAAAHNLVMMIHGDASVIERAFSISPRVRVLWAHLGTEPHPGLLASMLARYPDTLWIDTSVRDERIAPNGILLPDWRTLFERYPERFVVAVDTFSVNRWQHYDTAVARIRRWVDPLPTPLKHNLLHDNAARLFESFLKPAARQ